MTQKGHRGKRPRMPKDCWPTHGFCGACQWGVVHLLPVKGQCVVQCRIEKLGDLSNVDGCPHQELRTYEQTIVEVRALLDGIKANPVSDEDIRKWWSHPLDCPCYSCIRVRFFIDNYKKYVEAEKGGAYT